LRVIGAVVAVETPVWYSLHPYTDLHVPEFAIVKPDPAVRVVEVVSTFPMTMELRPGVNEATEAPVEPPLELPVCVVIPVVEYPESSYIETEPVTVEPKVAVIVSAPEAAAAPYQM